MPLRIKCPTGHSLIVPDDRAGRLLRCPRCSQAFTVPAAPQPKAPAVLTAVAVDQFMNAAAAAPSTNTALVEPPNEISDVPGRDTFHDDAVRETDAQRPVKPKSRVKPASVLAEAPPVEITPPAKTEPSQPAPIEEISPPAAAPETLPQVESSQPTGSAEPAAESHPFEFLSQPDDDIVEAPPVHRPAATGSPIAHDATLWSVYQLTAAVVAAALFSMVPAIWDVVEYVQIVESQFVARWALVLLFLGIVQLAYAVYLFQLPDWASVWVVTLQSLALAGLYAAVLGLVLISREEGFFVRALQLHDKLAGGKAVLWCLCMVCVWTIMAFFAGRLSVRWRHKEQLARQAVGYASRLPA